MRKLACAFGILAVGLAASMPARADYAVVKFKDNGVCRAWWDNTAKPWGQYQVLWVKVPTWDVAQGKGQYAMKHRWCKSWWN